MERVLVSSGSLRERDHRFRKSGASFLSPLDGAAALRHPAPREAATGPGRIRDAAPAVTPASDGVSYTFQFGDLWASRDELLDGAWLTVQLSAAAMVLSLVVAVAGALARTAGPRWLSVLVMAYVEVIRNTPFLVQIFLIFFGLPALGVRFSANAAALIALTANGGAYATEIVRAGIASIGQGQSEAGMALGLHRLRIFRLIVLPQALRAVVPPLGSQFILLMLNSSVCSAISADELTAAAQDVQSRTFRSFETYIVATGIYLVLSSLFSAGFATLDRVAFGRAVRAR